MALPRANQDLVLFESWHGRVADSPRALSEELHRRGSDLRQVWVTRPGSNAAPDWAEPIEADTRDYLTALGSAGLIVTNNTLPGYFRKRPATRLLQTWHGTPLKRIGLDVPQPSPMLTPKLLRHLRREARAWDWLVSPNRFSTEILRRAFGFQGEVLETGYPRNDALVAADADELRDAKRAALGIAPSTRVVLYAPTLRDGAPFQLRLDLELLDRNFADDVVVLLRAHELDRATLGHQAGGNVVDVSEVEDIRDLYLAADVLLTDYSSAMFDFAVTGKPILFFTYDLADYRDRLRGFYFDFEAEAPGPLLDTTEEVAAALADLDGVEQRFAPAYDRFRTRFCHLDDGGASKRVLAAVLG